MCHIVRLITFPDHDENRLKNLLSKGKAIYIPKYGVELGDYRKNDILETLWGDFLVVSHVETFEHRSTAKDYMIDSTLKEKIRQTYGNFDLLTLNKINSLAFFIPYKPYDKPVNYAHVRYVEIGIIFNKMVYQHRGLDNISINSLEEKCEEFNKRKTLYLPISINKNKLEECLHQDMTPIEFVLRCSGYSKRSTRQKFPSTGGTGGMDFCTEDYYDGSKSGDYYFQSIKEVYYFLKGMRIV